MNNAYYRARSKLATYGCKYVKLSNNVDPSDSIDSDFIYYSCKCGTEMIDQISYVDRTTTPLCSCCELLEIADKFYHHYRIVAFDTLSNWCQYRCEVCDRTIDAGARLAYKKVLMNKFICVQCNKQRKNKS